MCEKDTCDTVRYEDVSPYPEITVISPNEYYANLLFEDYSGQVSELTSFSQYEYHYIYNCKYDYKIVRHLRELAAVEKKHMEIIGELITLLGAYPVFRSSFQGNKCYWTGEKVAYGRTLTEQLKMDLEEEYRTICAYNTHIKLINDPGIKKLLARIVKDEYVHTTVLQALIRGDC